jgi:hypothetical protein
VAATVTLGAAELIDRARTATGLDDLGDASLPARLGSFAAQLDERLDDDGRARAASVIDGLLVDRLRFFDARARHPIDQERIERPIIVFGEPRSGTTLLQMLLGCDPGSRLLEFWEVMRLGTPPGVADPADVDERRRLADADWREILDQIQRWLVSHPYNAMLGRNPPECERLWAFDFRALPPSAWWRVPTTSFPPLRLERDDVRQLQIHRMVLQHLQFAAPPRRWVLKGTAHQHRLAALLDTYPDAVFVWIHRDPLVCLASRVELQAQVYEGVAGHLDRRAFATASVERSVGDFASMAADPLAADPRIHHVAYADFNADPVGVITDVYERASLDVDPALGGEVDRWLAANPPNRFGRFEYSVDALGVDVVELDRQLDPYRERFGVPRERPWKG